MLYGGRRSAGLNESESFSRLSGVNAYLGSRIDGSLRFVRGYIASIGAHKAHASDFRYILANPNFRRLFSSEAPKKKSKRLPVLVWNFFSFMFHSQLVVVLVLPNL